MSFIVQPLQFKVLSREVREYLTFLYLSFAPRPAGSPLKISPGIFLCRNYGALCDVLESGKRNVQNISIKCVARPIAPDEIEIRSRVGNPARASHVFILCNPPTNLLKQGFSAKNFGYCSISYRNINSCHSSYKPRNLALFLSQFLGLTLTKITFPGSLITFIGGPGFFIGSFYYPFGIIKYQGRC